MSVEKDAAQLISGLLGHIKQIVGEGASYAMLHYGAVEEGKRLGARFRTDDLQSIAAHVDAILSHRSEILKDDGSSVTLRLHDSRLLDTGQRSMQGIIVGLYEGALSSSRQARFKGKVVEPSANGELTLELRMEPS